MKIIRPLLYNLLFYLLFCFSLAFAQNLDQVQNLFTSPPTHPAYEVAYSPDGSLLAVALWDEAHSIKILDAHSGSQIASLVGHTNWVNSVAFSPDGKFLASASNDYSVKIWNTSNFSLLTSLEQHSGSVRSVAFSPDGDFLASASADYSVKIWNTSNFSLLTSLEQHSLAVTSVAFSPDGKFLASASRDKTVKIWNTSNFSLATSLEQHSDWVRSVAFSPDGNFLASASDDYSVKIWNTSNFSLLASLEQHSSFVLSVAFSPDGDFLASASRDNSVKIWDTRSGELLKTLQDHNHDVESVAFHPNGNLLASGAISKSPVNGKWQGTIRFWGTPSRQAVFCPSGCGATPPEVQYATVTINSTAGARVTINGQAIPESGNGVFAAQLLAGSHNLSIQKAGHSSISTSLNLQANQNIRFDFPLVQLAPQPSQQPAQQAVTPALPAPASAPFHHAPANLVSRGRRVALVMGNSRYQRTPLQNPVHDAEDIAAALGNLGFEVQLHYDLSFADMGVALGNFEASLQSADVGLVFFAGHGVEVDGENYLLPVDTNFSNKFNLKYSSLALSTVLGAFQAAKVGFSIVILDACRNNPFNRGGTGLRALDNAALSRDFAVEGSVPAGDVEGFFIAYATAPGTVAQDGAGRNSPYTEKILDYIYTPNLEIEDMFKNILTDFSQDPTTSQQPWRTDSVVGTFSFAPTR